ncbi:hypothetical protein ANO11243_048360 [Dothideomycetidae sp. 11243]|nr:hypothetical protein ANO11243_048360 [fungal sp. No.11243]
MSALYNVEPQPTGKVLLKTTSGDIVLELFAKQVPLASRNFLQHCLDGYYDNTLFHRLVPGFILQGGDPTGLGTGGESALEGGVPFEDEFHSRLRFNRRGLLGMANSGQKDDNTSQFFLTLDKTPELQGKNTMFGRVEGDTIYNLMKMGDAELAEEGGDRPLYPSRVLGAEVLVNPFEDMIKRTKVENRTKDEDKKIKKKRKPGKGMLSFGADEGDDAPVVKKAKVNPSIAAAEPPKKSSIPQQKVKPAPQAEISKRTRRRSTSSASSSPEPEREAPKKATQSSKHATAPSPSTEPEPAKPMSALERTNAEIAALKASMKRGADSEATKHNEKPKSALEAMIPATATRGRKRGRANQDDTKALNMLNAFRARLNGITAAASKTDGKATHNGDEKTNGTTADGTPGEEKLCDLHFIVNCQSCRAWDEDTKGDGDDDVDDPNWMAHTLSFAKDTLGKDLEWKRKMMELEEIDSRDEPKERVLKGNEDRDRRSGGRRDEHEYRDHDRRDRPRDKDSHRHRR